MYDTGLDWDWGTSEWEGEAVEITTPRGQARPERRIKWDVGEQREMGPVGVGLGRGLTRPMQFCSPVQSSPGRHTRNCQDLSFSRGTFQRQLERPDRLKCRHRVSSHPRTGRGRALVTVCAVGSPGVSGQCPCYCCYCCPTEANCRIEQDLM